jgi:hypothetical protein
MSKVLCFLDDYYGFDVLFQYLKEKIELIVSNKKSMRFAYHKQYNNPSKTSLQSEKDFIKVILWYSNLESKNKYIHKSLVEFLRPAEITSDEFISDFKALVKGAGNNLEKIVEICKTLDVYEKKSERLTSLLIDIANEACDKFCVEQSQLIEILGHDFILNLGLKSGIGGGPFPQDLSKRKEFLGILEKYQMHAKVKKVFEYALNRVNEDIKRYTEFYNNEKW